MKRLLILILTVACLFSCFSLVSFAKVAQTQDNTTSNIEKTLHIIVGKTDRFKNHTENVTYSSSNPSIVSVDLEGKITPHLLGSCTLTRKGGGKEITYPVIVRNSVVNSPEPSNNVSASATDFKLISIGGYTLSSGTEIKADFKFDNNNTVMVRCSQTKYTKNGLGQLANNNIIPLPLPNMDVNDIGIESTNPVIFTVSSNGVLQTNLKISDNGLYHIYIVTYDNIKKLSGTVSLSTGTKVEMNL